MMNDTAAFPPRHRRSDTVMFFQECDYDQDMVRGVSRVTWVGLFINVALAVVKTVGGVFSGSNALIADAIHTVSDLATDAAVLIGVRYWCAPADSEHPHGHRKIENLVTLAIGAALGALGLGLGYEAIVTLVGNLAGKEREAAAATVGFAAWVALAAALASIVGKELLYRWTVKRGIELESSAVVANAWHHRSDAFSSIPPAIAIGGGMLGSRMGYDLWFLDPIGTVIVCVMLLQGAWEVMAPALAGLLDESADRTLCSGIRKTVLDTPGVFGAHRIRTRVIGSNAVAVDLHVTVDRNLTVAEGHAIATDVKFRIMRLRVEEAKARVVEVLVHVEPADPLLERMKERREADTMVDWKL